MILHLLLLLVVTGYVLAILDYWLYLLNLLLLLNISINIIIL